MMMGDFEEAVMDAMEWKAKCRKLEAELAALKAANVDLQIHFDTIKAEYDQLKAKAAVPDGMALVPVEPTKEMIAAAQEGVER